MPKLTRSTSAKGILSFVTPFLADRMARLLRPFVAESRRPEDADTAGRTSSPMRCLAARLGLVVCLAQVSIAQCATQWLFGGGLPGANGSGDVYAVVLWDRDGQGPLPPAVVIGGQFTLAGTIGANNIAMYDPQSGVWSPLGTGIGGLVYDLSTLPNGDLVAGGVFTTAGGVPAENIARWDGTSWSALGAGIPGSVAALTTLLNGDLVVGGSFYTAGGVQAANIARWDGTAWASIGDAPGRMVEALTVLPNGDLVAGGNFITAGGVFCMGIARWNGTTWSGLGTGVAWGQSIQALTTLPNGDLVAGGYFTAIDGVSANSIARWNGTAWSAMGTGVSSAVFALTALPDGDVVAGGVFTAAGGVSVNNMARWNGTSWSTLGAGAARYMSAFTTLPNGDLVAGGSFTASGGIAAAYFARLTTTCPASATALGIGCTGSGGLNVLTATTLPWIGATFRAQATGMPALASALAVTGFTRVSIPIAGLLSQGVPGCDLQVSPDFTDLISTSGGSAHFRLVLPDSSSLIGTQFFHQMVSLELDQSSAIMAVTSTNALALTIGTF